MNFTREPIIETIISPKEGYKLVVRNSKSPSQEEFSVDALEVVSFGSALFYRSLERPKCFLLPVSDYEIMEARETRVVLKNASFEKNIKISGGKEAPRIRELPSERSEEETEESADQEDTAPIPGQSGANLDRKRDRRRNRRKRMHGERPAESNHHPRPAENGAEELVEAKEEVKAFIPTFTGLIPPPTTLISETIARYRESSKQEKSSPEDSFPSESESLAESEENPGNSIDE